MAKKFETSLIISGDSSGGLRAVRATREEVDRLVAQTNRAHAANQQFGQSSEQEFGRGIPLIKQGTTALVEYAKAAAAVFAVGKMAHAADEWGTLNARIKNAAENSSEYERAQQRIYQIAQKNRTALEGVSDLYVNSVALLRDQGLNNEQALDFVDIVSTGVRATGANAQDAASIFQALDISIAQGRMQMDQFNTLNLKARPILMALAKAMGTNETQLLKMVQAGQLTTDKWLKPFQTLGPVLNEMAQGLPDTIAGAVTNLESAFTKYVGEANQGVKATQAFASSLTFLSDHMNEVFAVAGMAAAGKFAQVLSKSATETLKSAAASIQREKASKRETEATNREIEATNRRIAAEENAARAEMLRARSAQQSAQSELMAARAEQQRLTVTAALARGTENEVAASLALSSANDRVAASESAVSAARLRNTEATATLNKLTAAQATATTTFTQRLNVLQRAINSNSVALRVMGRSASTMLGALGGIPGLLLTVGSMAATWYLFSASAKDANKSVDLLNTSLAETIEKTKTLSRAQQENLKKDLAAGIDEQTAAMKRSLIGVKQAVFNEVGVMSAGPLDGLRITKSIDEVVNKVKEGTLSAGEAVQQLNSKFELPKSVLDSIIELASQYDTAGQNADNLREKLAAANGKIGESGQAINQFGNESRNIDLNSQAWTTFVQNLEQSRDTLGMTAAEIAKYQAQQKGFAAEQAGYAGAIAGETDALKQYQAAIESSSSAEAKTQLARARNQAEQAAMWRAQGEAVAEMAEQFAIAEKLVGGLSNSISAAALSVAVSVSDMNKHTGQYVSDALAQVEARAKALRANPSKKTTHSSGKSAGQKLSDSYKQQERSLREQAALQGVNTNAAKVRYQTEQGELKKLTAAQKSNLVSLAQQLDQKSLAQQAKDRLKDYDQQIALLGKQGDAAQVAYSVEHGELTKLEPKLKEQLKLRAKELDQLRERQQLISTYLPDQSPLTDLAKGKAGIKDGLSGDAQRYAEKNLAQRVKDFATQGLPSIQGLDASVAGPFGEAARLMRENAKYQKAYEKRLALLQAYADRRIEIEGATEEQSKGIASAAQQAISDLQESHNKNTLLADEQMRVARMAGYSSMFGSMADSLEVFVGKSSGLYKAAFAVSKAFAIGQAAMLVPATFMETYRSASAVPIVGPFIAPPLAAAAAATQLAQASAIKSSSLTGMAHDGISSVPREGTWLLDTNERVLNSTQNRDLTDYLAQQRQSMPKGRDFAGGVNLNMAFSPTINMSGRNGRDDNESLLEKMRQMVQENGQQVINEVWRQLNADSRDNGAYSQGLRSNS
ncbi:tape measure protein [Carnimonas bestiolae]|uniref:tape measure protein n=1 Tax=Carnimonas bestiolae TaxID=3402172 RepID=UPI003EDC1082